MTKSTTYLPKRALAAAVLAVSGLMAAAGAHAESLDAIVKAVKFDDIADIGKQLKAGKLDPNTLAPNGDPLLVIAAREKSDKVAAALAATPNVDLEKEDKAGENALMLASLNGDAGLVKLLIDKGAEVSKKGWAPLHYAATNGHDDVVKILLDHDAYID
ncbi:MAG: ankyrin repeat domain-containing protein, partial [Burkholderia vietnamiensis]|nr:ankyrin repeat domain-containing protein [Burkholderia vietnamiensis]